MARQTISALLSMQKALRTRMGQLENFKEKSAHRYIHYEEKKRTEPTYDVVAVDEKIVAINQALFNIDVKIKESNAKVKLEVDVDLKKLTSAIPNEGKTGGSE